MLQDGSNIILKNMLLNFQLYHFRGTGKTDTHTYIVWNIVCEEYIIPQGTINKKIILKPVFEKESEKWLRTRASGEYFESQQRTYKLRLLESWQAVTQSLRYSRNNSTKSLASDAGNAKWWGRISVRFCNQSCGGASIRLLMYSCDYVIVVRGL
jgi:hypothetical protein